MSDTTPTTVLTPLLDPVRQLSAWLQDTDICSLELRGPDTRIALQRQGGQLVLADTVAATATASAPPAPPAAAAAAAATGISAVRAGSVGVLRLAHPGREQPLVRVGQSVAAGQPLALLQIGLVLLPVLAPRAGVVQRIVAADDAAVGYGSLLFELA